MAPAKLSDLETIFGNVVKYALGFAGIALFCMLLLGGFNYLTSGDNPKATEAAQKTITYAIGGLVLVLVSYLILVLIYNITNVNVTEFKVFIQ